MKKRSDVIGAILAGGKSTRMGAEKALLQVEGRSMIQCVAETLSTLFEEVIIVGGAKNTYRFLRLEVVPDAYEACGPLGGIHAALKRAKPKPVFILSCDTPLIPAALIEYLLGTKPTKPSKIAAFQDVLQPLCGLYDGTSIRAIEDDLRKGKYSVLKTIQRIEHTVIPITPDLPFFYPHMFLNVNRPEDYQLISDSSAGNRHG